MIKYIIFILSLLILFVSLFLNYNNENKNNKIINNIIKYRKYDIENINVKNILNKSVNKFGGSYKSTNNNKIIYKIKVSSNKGNRVLNYLLKNKIYINKIYIENQYPYVLLEIIIKGQI